MNTVHSFTTSFRRVMHLAALLNEACEYLEMEQETPGRLAAKTIDLRKAYKGLITFCQQWSPGTWEALKADLSSEQLHDTQLIIDELEGIENVGEILEVLREMKQEAVNLLNETELP